MEKVNKEKADEVRRSFEFENDDGVSNTYYLGMPTSDQIRKADWHYSKIYNKALVDGVATLEEMMDILRQRNIIGIDHERKIEELNKDIAQKVVKMEDTEDEFEKMRLALEVRDLRNKLFRWNQRVTGPLSNTCEQIAEDAKTEYLTYAMAQNESGSPIWESFDQFLQGDDIRLSVKARLEVLLWLQGLDSDFLDKTPEGVVLKNAEESAKAKSEARRLQAAVQASEDAADKAVEEVESQIGTKKKKVSKKA